MPRWFPRLQDATACFSCSPPKLNFLNPYFIFMYMHNNNCHLVTAHLQLNILLNYYYYYYYYYYLHANMPSSTGSLVIIIKLEAKDVHIPTRFVVYF
jgi:hypothetical protein